MCGICGVYSPDAGDDARLRAGVTKMCKLIEHRGPDEHGVYVDEGQGLALGHQRLSIIDVSDGQQPLSNGDGSLWIVFNGEIYNYRDLRKRLVAKGYRFKTHSDTETILFAYSEWGEACVDHLQGMFSFVIWDAKKESVFCARDHVGVKPLYYYWDGTSFIFASELKAVIAHDLVKKEMNHDAIVNFLRLQYIPAPDTVFKNINKLPAAHTLLIRNGQLKIGKYWEIDIHSNAFSGGAEEARQALRTRLQESVDMQLVSEVPIGAFLSGGTDSSVVVSLMNNKMRGAIKTQCVGFEQREYDERQYARYIADRFETDHSETMVHLAIDDELDKIIWHMDEPFADASAIPTYYLCREARKRVTVCLSGDGGDELFSGYNWYEELARLSRMDDKVPRSLRKTAGGLLFNHMPATLKGGTLLRNIAADLSTRHKNLRSYFSDSFIESLLVDAPSYKPKEIVHPIDVLYSNIGKADDVVKAAQLVDFQSYMVEDILMKVDKMSMAHSLEVRVPILDHKVVELAFSLGTEMKMTPESRKIILKESVSDLIPREFFERKKQGFSVPMRYWLQNQLKERVGDFLLSGSTSQSGLFRQKSVESLWKQFSKQSYRIDLENHIWSLLSFELWYDQFVSK